MTISVRIESMWTPSFGTEIIDIPTQKLTKQNLVRLFSAVVVIFVTPYILSWYLMLIFSLSLLEPLGWIYQTFANPLLIGLSVVFGVVGILLLYNMWEVHFWKHYFSELVASIIVLTMTLCVILLVSGTAALEYSRVGRIRVENADVLFLVIFLSFGLLLANIRAVVPVLKDIITSIISAYLSRFVPPYTELNVEINGLNRPPIVNSEPATSALGIGIFSAGSVLVLSWVVLWMGKFGDFIQGHLSLLGYLRDVFSADPEKILNGTFGVLEETVRILDPQVLFVYLLILVLSYTYAVNAIYFTRIGLEQVRVRLGVSQLNMTALTVLLSFFLLIVSSRIATYLFVVTSAIISIELA